MRRKSVSEQVMVITGASSGIGRATALLAARRGAAVVLTARSAQELEEIVAEIRAAQGRAAFHPADVTEPAQLQEVAALAQREFGRIDTWVNVAGISAYGRIEELTLEDMRRVMDVTFWGVVHGSRAALPHLRESGGGLINIGSEASSMPVPLQGPYVAAKHAVAGFTDVLRLELEKEGAPVSLTLIRPGSIDTPFFQHSKSATGQEPLPPPPVYAPELVAEAILYCAQHPRRDLVVGGGARAMIGLARWAPGLSDRLFEATLFRSQQGGKLARSAEGALYRPGGASAVRGGYSGRKLSLYTQAQMHPWLGVFALAALGTGVALAARRSL